MGAEGAIVRFLGGRKALGRTPASMDEWHATIRGGMSVDAAESLKALMSVPDALMAELLGISEKTLSRTRSAHGRLDAVASDRLFRVARIAALAVDVLESEEGALAWLKRPQTGLGGEVPLALLTTHAGIDEVEKLLLRIEHGVYA